MKDRPFRDWVITRYTATSPDMKYKLWIANGFVFFEDYESTQQLLSVVSVWHRYRLWRKLRQEIISRIDEILL